MGIYRIFTPFAGIPYPRKIKQIEKVLSVPRTFGMFYGILLRDDIRTANVESKANRLNDHVRPLWALLAEAVHLKCAAAGIPGAVEFL